MHMPQGYYTSHFPLNNTFAAVSILGLVISVVASVQGMLNVTWGTTMIVFFTILFISSLITLRPTVYQHY